VKELYGPTLWWDRVRGRAPEVLQFHRYYLEAAEPGQRTRMMVPVVEPGSYDDYDISEIENLWHRLGRAWAQAWAAWRTWAALPD
jgi:hypothetical protein